MTRAIIGAVTLAVLAGCSSSGSDVTWSDYAPAVKTTIDQLKDSKDCNGLQQQFDNADANDSATRARVGHGNAALMGYINDAMRAAGCY
jgi:hypothetical protein